MLGGREGAHHRPERSDVGGEWGGGVEVGARLQRPGYPAVWVRWGRRARGGRYLRVDVGTVATIASTSRPGGVPPDGVGVGTSTGGASVGVARHEVGRRRRVPLARAPPRPAGSRAGAAGRRRALRWRRRVAEPLGELGVAQLAQRVEEPLLRRLVDAAAAVALDVLALEGDCEQRVAEFRGGERERLRPGRRTRGPAGARTAPPPRTPPPPTSIARLPAQTRSPTPRRAGAGRGAPAARAPGASGRAPAGPPAGRRGAGRWGRGEARARVAAVGEVASTSADDGRAPGRRRVCAGVAGAAFRENGDEGVVFRRTRQPKGRRGGAAARKSASARAVRRLVQREQHAHALAEAVEAERLEQQVVAAVVGKAGGGGERAAQRDDRGAWHSTHLHGARCRRPCPLCRRHVLSSGTMTTRRRSTRTHRPGSQCSFFPLPT